jgi:molybdopterin/thiamine biosynthesis adenylyltransferase
MGPVVGVVGALQADLALALLAGAPDVAGQIVTFDGKTGRMRRRTLAAQSSCPLSGLGRIEAIEPSRYTSAASCE